jgi:hypothetical protein
MQGRHAYYTCRGLFAILHSPQKLAMEEFLSHENEAVSFGKKEKVNFASGISDSKTKSALR